MFFKSKNVPMNTLSNFFLYNFSEKLHCKEKSTAHISILTPLVHGRYIVYYVVYTCIRFCFFINSVLLSLIFLTCLMVLSLPTE